MATIRIGDRELEVKVATVGFLKYQIIPWRKRLQATNDDEVEILDWIVDGIALYLGDQVTRDWLEATLPATAHEVLRACAEASGLAAPKAGASAGEAPRQ